MMRTALNGKAGLAFIGVCIGALMLSACDSAIYDYEGDCSVNYRVTFRYDYNMKFADAFAHEVDTVTLYLLDQSGNVVWQGAESGDTLATKDYAMTVNVPAGRYSLLAWCGSRGNKSFSIPRSIVVDELACTMKRTTDPDGTKHVREDLDRLFHGYLPTQTFPDTEGTYYYDVPLVKNTNNIRIVLQHLSGEPVDKDKFHFTITDNNGRMDWDNSLLADDKITYHAWRTDSGVAGTTDPDNTRGGTHAFSAAIAELTVPRLMTDHDPRLTVTNVENGEIVFSIPLIDYALLVKGFYNSDMDDQEYLDRQDEYNMTFFIDEGYRWVNSYVYINSWKIVLQETEL